MLSVTAIGLLISVILSLVGMGIIMTIDYSDFGIDFSNFLNFGKNFLRISILLNPIGVLADYMCSLLIEEHRIEANVEVDTN